MRLNGWHGLSLCSVDYGSCVAPLSTLMAINPYWRIVPAPSSYLSILWIHPLHHLLHFNVSVQFCIVLLTTSYASMIFLAAYSHRVCLYPTIIITFLPHLWSPVTVFMVLFLPTVVFNMAPCNLIWPIKTLAARLLIVQGWGGCQAL